MAKKVTKKVTKRKKVTPRWVKLGVVGVDSGQLMICDPCYLDKSWKQGEFKDIRVYKDVKTGAIFAYDTPEAREHLASVKAEFFENYESRLSTGLTPNESNARRLWAEQHREVNEFSYDGVSHKGASNFKQVNYEMGHPGLAVAFQSGYGDGTYDVKGLLNEEGRIVEVRVVMA